MKVIEGEGAKSKRKKAKFEQITCISRTASPFPGDITVTGAWPGRIFLFQTNH
jgi:hypothetical protein